MLKDWTIPCLNLMLSSELNSCTVGRHAPVLNLSSNSRTASSTLQLAAQRSWAPPSQHDCGEMTCNYDTVEIESFMVANISLFKEVLQSPGFHDRQAEQCSLTHRLQMGHDPTLVQVAYLLGELLKVLDDLRDPLQEGGHIEGCPSDV